MQRASQAGYSLLWRIGELFLLKSFTRNSVDIVVGAASSKFLWFHRPTQRSGSPHRDRDLSYSAPLRLPRQHGGGSVPAGSDQSG